MCFYINKKYPDKLIAKRDIKCYKTLFFSSSENYIISEYYRYIYKQGIQENIISLNIIIENPRYVLSEPTHIDKGYHSYISIKTILKDKYPSFNRIIAIFIIPKGTEYYKNDTEMVSSNIFFTGEYINRDEFNEKQRKNKKKQWL